MSDQQAKNLPSVLIGTSTVGSDGVKLSVSDVRTLDTIVTDVSLDDVLEGQGRRWNIADVHHPITVPETSMSMRCIFEKLAGLKREAERLARESFVAPTAERAQALQAQHEECQRKLKAVRLVVLVAVKSTTGLWPYEMREVL